jgi:hypothetical protein
MILRPYKKIELGKLCRKNSLDDGIFSFIEKKIYGRMRKLILV